MWGEASSMYGRARERQTNRIPTTYFDAASEMNRRIVVVLGLRIQVGEDKKGEGGSETEGLDLQLVLEPRHEATRARERESEVEAEEGDGVDVAPKTGGRFFAPLVLAWFVVKSEILLRTRRLVREG